jgi:peptidyl-prolyl cis-trans isomerase C
MGQRIVLAVILAILATSCQKKASGQTVAVVNNEEITASDLNAELAGENVPVTGNTKEARAAALQKLINRRMLAQEARAEGIDKSPEFLNRERAGIDDLLISMLVSRKVNTSQVPTADEISRYEASRPEMFANREIWTLQQIVYPLPQPPALDAKIKAANTLDEVAQALTSSGVQFTRVSKQIDTAIFPHNIYAQLMALKPGEPFVAPGPGKAIASVVSARQPAPLTGDQARSAALNAMRRDQVQKFIQDQVKRLKTTAKIEYQPGFAPSKS